MQRRIGVGALVAILCAFALTGCGGDGSGEPAAAATAGATTSTRGLGADFVTRVDALCAELTDHFAADLRAALSDTDHLAEAVRTTEPEALAPVFAAAVAGFGRAIDLVAQVRGDFAALEAPSRARDAIEAVDAALGALSQMLTAVRDAATDQDLARFATALNQLHHLDQAQLDAAAQQLADLGALTCRPPG